MGALLSDLQFATRIFRKNPLFAIGVVLLLTLGIGVSSAVFSVVDAFQLRRLPVRNPEELVRLAIVEPNNFTYWKLPFELCDGVGSKAASLSDVVCQDEQDVAISDGSPTNHAAVAGEYNPGRRECMNTISRRLRKLEDILGSPIETESSRRLQARLEAGRRRIAELRGEPVQVRRFENLADARPGLQTVVEILQSGRQRLLSGTK